MESTKLYAIVTLCGAGIAASIARMAATGMLETLKAKAMLTWQRAASFHFMVHKADCTPAVDDDARAESWRFQWECTFQNLALS